MTRGGVGFFVVGVGGGGGKEEEVGGEGGVAALGVGLTLGVV